MIWNYSDQRSQSYKRAKNKKKCSDKNLKIIHEIRKKFVKLPNYSGLIQSKFSQPNNFEFTSVSLKNKLFGYNW